MAVVAAPAAPILPQIDVATDRDLRYRSAPSVAPGPALRYPSDVARFHGEPVQEAPFRYVVVRAHAVHFPSDVAPALVAHYRYVVVPELAVHSP